MSSSPHSVVTLTFSDVAQHSQLSLCLTFVDCNLFILVSLESMCIDFSFLFGTGLHDTVVYCSLHDPATPCPAGYTTTKVRLSFCLWGKKWEFFTIMLRAGYSIISVCQMCGSSLWLITLAILFLYVTN